MNTEPKPATGEDDIHSIVACVPHDEAAKIIAFHNAALAAAWRKGHADAQAPALERIDELHKQLAAANETEAIKVVWRRVVTLEQQLAAAWEALVTVRELREHDQKALAAEREKVKNLQRQLDDFGYSMRTNE